MIPAKFLQHRNARIRLESRDRGGYRRYRHVKSGELSPYLKDSDDLSAWFREVEKRRLPNADKHAANIFEKAKTKYGEEFWSVEAASKDHFQQRISRISCVTCPTCFPVFSTIEIGLKHG